MTQRKEGAVAAAIASNSSKLEGTGVVELPSQQRTTTRAVKAQDMAAQQESCSRPSFPYTEPKLQKVANQPVGSVLLPDKHDAQRAPQSADTEWPSLPPPAVSTVPINCSEQGYIWKGIFLNHSLLWSKLIGLLPNIYYQGIFHVHFLFVS